MWITTQKRQTSNNYCIVCEGKKRKRNILTCQELPSAEFKEERETRERIRVQLWVKGETERVNVWQRLYTMENQKYCRMQKNMQEVTRDMLLLSTGSVRERRHCLLVKSSIVTLTQNDSLDLAQNLCCSTLLSHVHKCFSVLCKCLHTCQANKKKTALPNFCVPAVTLIFHCALIHRLQPQMPQQWPIRMLSSVKTSHKLQDNRPGHTSFATNHLLSDEIQQCLHQTELTLVISLYSFQRRPDQCVRLLTEKLYRHAKPL